MSRNDSIPPQRMGQIIASIARLGGISQQEVLSIVKDMNRPAHEITKDFREWLKTLPKG